MSFRTWKTRRLSEEATTGRAACDVSFEIFLGVPQLHCFASCAAVTCHTREKDGFAEQRYENVNIFQSPARTEQYHSALKQSFGGKCSTSKIRNGETVDFARERGDDASGSEVQHDASRHEEHEACPAVQAQRHAHRSQR